MRKGSHFFRLLVETYSSGPLSGHRGTVRVRAVYGQGVDCSLLVECSRPMRSTFPVGTVFFVRVKYASRLGGQPYLKWDKSWGFQVATAAEIENFLAYEQFME